MSNAEMFHLHSLSRCPLCGGSFRNRDESIEVVVGLELVSPLESADDAPMHDNFPLPFLQSIDRLHHPSARLEPVARILIDMLRPETFRAMVRISRAADLRAAFFAGEVLDRAREFFRHERNIAKSVSS